MNRYEITAEFIGIQENPTGPDWPMYNIVNGPYHGSTVAAETLNDLGIPIPTPCAPGQAGD